MIVTVFVADCAEGKEGNGVLRYAANRECNVHERVGLYIDSDF